MAFGEGYSREQLAGASDDDTEAANEAAEGGDFPLPGQGSSESEGAREEGQEYGPGAKRSGLPNTAGEVPEQVKEGWGPDSEEDSEREEGEEGPETESEIDIPDVEQLEQEPDNLKEARQKYLKGLRLRGKMIRGGNLQKVFEWFGGDRRSVEFEGEELFFDGDEGKESLLRLRRNYEMQFQASRNEKITQFVEGLPDDVTETQREQAITEFATNLMEADQRNENQAYQTLDENFNDASFREWWRSDEWQSRRRWISGGLLAGGITAGIASAGTTSALAVGARGGLAGAGAFVGAEERLENVHAGGKNDLSRTGLTADLRSEVTENTEGDEINQAVVDQAVANLSDDQLNRELSRLRMLANEEGASIEEAATGSDEVAEVIISRMLERERQQLANNAVESVGGRIETAQQKDEAVQTALMEHFSAEEGYMDEKLKEMESSAEIERKNKQLRRAIAAGVGGTVGWFVGSGTMGRWIGRGAEWLGDIEIPGLPWEETPELGADTITINEQGEGMTQAIKERLQERGMSAERADEVATGLFYEGEPDDAVKEMYNNVHIGDEFTIDYGDLSPSELADPSTDVDEIVDQIDYDMSSFEAESGVDPDFEHPWSEGEAYYDESGSDAGGEMSGASEATTADPEGAQTSNSETAGEVYGDGEGMVPLSTEAGKAPGIPNLVADTEAEMLAEIDELIEGAEDNRAVFQDDEYVYGVAEIQALSNIPDDTGKTHEMVAEMLNQYLENHDISGYDPEALIDAVETQDAPGWEEWSMIKIPKDQLQIPESQLDVEGIESANPEAIETPTLEEQIAQTPDDVSAQQAPEPPTDGQAEAKTASNESVITGEGRGANVDQPGSQGGQEITGEGRGAEAAPSESAEGSQAGQETTDQGGQQSTESTPEQSAETTESETNEVPEANQPSESVEGDAESSGDGRGEVEVATGEEALSIEPGANESGGEFAERMLSEDAVNAENLRDLVGHSEKGMDTYPRNALAHMNVSDVDIPPSAEDLESIIDTISIQKGGGGLVSAVESMNSEQLKNLHNVMEYHQATRDLGREVINVAPMPEAESIDALQEFINQQYEGQTGDSIPGLEESGYPIGSQ